MKKNPPVSVYLILGFSILAVVFYSVWNRSYILRQISHKEEKSATEYLLLPIPSYRVTVPDNGITMSNILLLAGLSLYEYYHSTSNAVITNLSQLATSTVEIVLLPTTNFSAGAVGYRPANLRELLGLLIQHREMMETNTVVAFGTERRRSLGGKSEEATYPVLSWGDILVFVGGREWPPSYQFAFVKIE